MCRKSTFCTLLFCGPIFLFLPELFGLKGDFLSLACLSPSVFESSLDSISLGERSFRIFSSDSFPLVHAFFFYSIVDILFRRALYMGKSFLEVFSMRDIDPSRLFRMACSV